MTKGIAPTGMNRTTLIAFKYGEGPFRARDIFCNDTSDAVLSAAWLFYLIRYREHIVLVDTGIGDLDVIGRYGFHMDRFSRPVDLLREYGLTPDEITDVIVTHAHFDHIGDLGLYRKAELYVHEAESDACRKFIDDMSRVHTFRAPLKLFDRFTIEPVGGHTAGSSIVTFRQGRTGYVLAGDECYLHANLERRIPTGRSYDISRSRWFVEKYAKPRYRVLFCHEPAVVEGNPGFKVILP